MIAPASRGGGISPDNVLGTLFDSVPTLADLPDRCAEAIAILTHAANELAAKTDQTDCPAQLSTRSSELTRSLKRSRALPTQLARSNEG